MATPYVASFTIRYADGTSEQISVTGDDVTTNNLLGVDGLAPIRMSGSHGNGAIVDVAIAPAPTSCRTAQIRINGKRVPEVLLLGANLGTTVGRQLQQNPIRFNQGDVFTFDQLT